MVCVNCKEKKARHQMSRSKGNLNWCRTCVAANAKTRRKDPVVLALHNQRSHRAKLIRRGVSISEEEFLRWWRRASKENCHICEAPPSSNRHGKLYLDHDHRTGKIRGLLCSQCNTALGLLKDDPSLIAKAYQYIRRNHDT